MSIIDKLGENNKNLSAILMMYEEDLAEAETHLSLKGKMLGEANMEQASWQSYYDNKRIELYSLLKHMETEVERVRGKLWIRFTEKHSCILNQKDKEQYINNEPAYLNMNALLIEVKEAYNKYESLVEAFRSRGFALRNITNLRVAQLEDVVL